MVLGPATPEQLRTAGRDVRLALLLRAALGGLVCLALLVAAVLAYRHGVRDDSFPPFVAGTSRTTITRYSGPWIAVAAGALLGAGLIAIRVAADLVHRRRLPSR